MNLKSLFQNDIKDFKNIKLGDVRSQFQSRPMAGLKVVLVVLAAGILLYGLSMGNKRKQALMNELGEKQKKFQIFQNLQTIKADHDLFFKNLPQMIEQDNLMKVISDLAEKHDIQIESFSPNQRKFNDLVKANVVELSVTAERYENLADFIESIEKSPYFLRVEKWSGRLMEVASRDANHEIKEIVTARLEVVGLMIDEGAQPAK